MSYVARWVRRGNDIWIIWQSGAREMWSRLEKREEETMSMDGSGPSRLCSLCHKFGSVLDMVYSPRIGVVHEECLAADIARRQAGPPQPQDWNAIAQQTLQHIANHPPFVAGFPNDGTMSQQCDHVWEAWSPDSNTMARGRCIKCGAFQPADPNRNPVRMPDYKVTSQGAPITEVNVEHLLSPEQQRELAERGKRECDHEWEAYSPRPGYEPFYGRCVKCGMRQTVTVNLADPIMWQREPGEQDK